MTIDILRDGKDLNKYFYVKYEIVSSATLYEAAFGIAVGQSIGNPSKRSVWETPELIEAYCAKIVQNDYLQCKQGLVEIAYPLANSRLENGRHCATTLHDYGRTDGH